MRKIVVMLLGLLLVCMQGCSSSELTVSSDGTSVYINKKAVDIDEYNGIEAVKIVPEFGYIQFYPCEHKLIDCPHNMLGILPEDMDTHKNKSKFYGVYHNTYMYLMIPQGDDVYTECCFKTEESYAVPIEQAVEQMYEIGKNLKFAKLFSTAYFKDVIKVNAGYYDLIVRPAEILLRNVLKVTVNDNSVKMTAQFELGGHSLGKASDNSYDYYLYQDILIKAASGTDISKYIEIIEE